MNSFPPQLPPGFDGPLAQSPLAQSPLAQSIPEGTGLGRPSPLQLTALGRQWSALHRAAAAVASLGGIDMAPQTPEIAGFPSRVERLTDWRAGLARQGVADLAAVMEPGLTALIAVHRRGADPAAAAQALMHEFTHARDALLAIANDIG